MSWRSIIKAGKKALPFAVLVGVALLLVLFRHELRHHLHRAIAVEETPVSIESVQSLGELVTAAYYGEVVCTLEDAYTGIAADQLGRQYQHLRQQLLARSPIEHTRYYRLLRHLCAEDREAHFHQLVLATPWAQFARQYHAAIRHVESRLAGHRIHNEELMYIARGTVTAGFQLQTLGDSALKQQGDTVDLHQLSPTILETIINPWLAVPDSIAGYQLLMERHAHHISLFEQSEVKQSALHKLKQQAIENGLLERALHNGQRDLASLVPTLQQCTVHVHPRCGYRKQAQLLADDHIDKAEVAQLARTYAEDSITAPHRSDTTCIRALIAHLDTVVPPHHRHSLWGELTHAIENAIDPKRLLHWRTQYHSPHRAEASRTAAHGHSTEAEWDHHHGSKRKRSNKTQFSDEGWKHVGFYPYYMGSAYQHLDYSQLWAIAWWGIEVDPATGKAQNLHQWPQSKLPSVARKHGSKVLLSLTNLGFEPNRQLFTNSEAQAELLRQVPEWLALHQADGVIIDFEEVPGSLSKPFNQWLVKLAHTLRGKGYQTAVCLYAVDFGHVFDLPLLKDALDLFVIMGYDYYYAGSRTTGPVAPLASSQGILPYNLKSSVDYYLTQGAPAHKLVLALPRYGRQWKAASTQLPAHNLGFVKSWTIGEATAAHLPDSSSIEPQAQSMVYRSRNTAGHYLQLWYDDEETLEAKAEWAKTKGLAGVGWWALGY